MRELLFMEPVFKEAIWGGTRLKDVFGYDLSLIHIWLCQLARLLQLRRWRRLPR